MGKEKLSKNQLLAALVVNYEELKTILSLMPKMDKIKDDQKCRKRILADLKHLITDGLSFDIDKVKIEKLFGQLD
jgi:hypothetical protein